MSEHHNQLQTGPVLQSHLFLLKRSLSWYSRYRPEEQADLKPHDDNSIYTTNMALNKPGIDFEGGGTKFHR